ncbi:MAG: glycerophosphodiester phosphodiesterase [Vicinamibacterales bacterium]
MIDPLLSLEAVRVIAHRGGSALRPENTLAAFDHARTLGVDAFECDVHLSRDREPVVIHDPTLDRTTDRTGPVAALTAAELAEVDAGHRFDAAGGHPFRGHGHGVPRLADLLARHPDVPLVVEVKGDQPETAARVLEVIRGAGALDRVIVGGFSLDVLRVIRTAAPEVPTSAARPEVQAALRRAWLGWPPRRTGFRLIQAPFRLRGRRIFGRAFVRAARRGAVPVHAWIVDDPAEMRQLVAWGVTGLISDRPDVAVEVRDALR